MLAPGLLWLLGLYLLPLLGLVPLSLSEPLSRFGLETVFRGRLAIYLEVLQAYGPILWRSFGYAASATAIGLLLAYPLAFAIRFRGGSDAMIVAGLVAMLLHLFSDQQPEDILAFDAPTFMREIGIADALTPQRSNGLASMLQRIRAHAGEA